MQLRGHLYRITNPRKFIPSYLASRGAQPSAESFQPYSGGRVYLAFDRKVTLNDVVGDPVAAAERLAGMVPFIPDHSVRAQTNGAGAFAFEIPEPFGIAAKLSDDRARLVVYRVLVRAMGVEVLGPVYRSPWFTLGKAASSAHNLYFLSRAVPDSDALGGEAVKAQLKSGIPANATLNSLLIEDGGFSVGATVKEGGYEAKVAFKVKLRPLTSADQSRLIVHRIEDFDIDLPGPDALTNAVIGIGAAAGSEDAKRAKKALDTAQNVVSRAVGSFVDKATRTLMQGLISEITPSGIPEDEVRKFMAANAVVSIERLRWPLISEDKIGWTTIKRRGIVPDLGIAFPRHLE
jgi:hypothetical protein